MNWIKNYIHYIIIELICGFIVFFIGYAVGKSHQKTVIKKETVTATEKKAQFDTVSYKTDAVETHHDVVFLERFFRKDGTLLKDIYKSQDYDANESTSNSTRSVGNSDETTVVSQRDTTTIYGRDANFLVGIFADVSHWDSDHASAQFGFNTISNIYLTAQIDSDFSMGPVGFIFVKPKFLFGLHTDFMDLVEGHPSKISVEAGYRIFPHFYLVAQTNSDLSKTQAGFSITY